MTLVNQQVLDVQVRDETYRQFEEAAAARDQADAMVSETKSALDQAIADRDRAQVDVEAARADLVVAQADEREAKVNVEYGRIKAPFHGVITQRNVSPGDYLQPGGGTNGRPLFVLEQIDPVRVFVGVPELASYFVHDSDTALIRFQAIPGVTREGKVVRSGFSLNPSTRTLQTEIDIPNSDGHLHPGWYVTVTIAIDRKQVWTLPSNAIGFQGGQNYFVYFQVDGKPVRTPVIVGPSDDTHTEVIKKYVAKRQHQRLADLRRDRKNPGGEHGHPGRRRAAERTSAGGAVIAFSIYFSSDDPARDGGMMLGSSSGRPPGPRRSWCLAWVVWPSPWILMNPSAADESYWSPSS